jgi:hypothetical protein
MPAAVAYLACFGESALRTVPDSTSCTVFSQSLIGDRGIGRLRQLSTIHSTDRD